jgi:hypothetical protein
MGEGTAKGYVLEEMLDALRRYVPRSEVDALRVQTKEEAEAKAREENQLQAGAD